MSRKLALKRLRASDLSFFETYLRRYPQTKQKALNLDRSIIEGQFFPGLEAVALEHPENEVPVKLHLSGPDAKPANALWRKIKREHKNWRLNGEYIPDPLDDPSRYAALAPDDLVLLDFGEDAKPAAVKALLLSASSPRDAAIHAAISQEWPVGSMTVVEAAQLHAIVASASPDAGHPVLDWLDDDLLEEIGLGDGLAPRQLMQRRAGRGLTSAELQAAKASAETTGRRGEELLNHHLSVALWPGFSSYQWVAAENAVAPYDFSLTTNAGADQRADAKSTSGRFENEVHMSLGEIEVAVNGGVLYNIVRLYEVREGSAKYRIARDVGTRLKAILDLVGTLPSGVRPDSFSFAPSFFDFESIEHIIEMTDDSQ